MKLLHPLRANGIAFVNMKFHFSSLVYVTIEASVHGISVLLLLMEYAS